jgi:hypothetical protein
VHGIPFTARSLNVLLSPECSDDLTPIVDA